MCGKEGAGAAGGGIDPRKNRIGPRGGKAVCGARKGASEGKGMIGE